MNAGPAPPDSGLADIPRSYRSNRRLALVTRALIVLGTVLLGVPLLVLGLTNVVLAATLAGARTDAYQAMVLWAASWEIPVAWIFAVGFLAKALAGIAVSFWIARSVANLRELPVPEGRWPSGLLLAPPIFLFPALVWAYAWLRVTFPQASALSVALAVAATISLTLPLGVIRRLWIASGTQGSAGSQPPVWGGVWVWWLSYVAGWIALGCYALVPWPGWSDQERVMSYHVVRGLLEIAAVAAVVIAAVFMIRVMSRINAMQDALARTSLRSGDGRERRAIAPARGLSAQ